MITSNSFFGLYRIAFQSVLFGLGLALSGIYISFKYSSYQSLWNKFSSLSTEMRFFLSIFIVSLVYFGGAMYVSPNDVYETSHTKKSRESHSLEPGVAIENIYPASADGNIGFVVPDRINPDDLIFFESFLTR